MQKEEPMETDESEKKDEKKDEEKTKENGKKETEDKSEKKEDEKEGQKTDTDKEKEGVWGYNVYFWSPFVRLFVFML